MQRIYYSRAPEIETLKQIIANAEYYKENSENGLSIIVNGAWGSGKTKFIENLKDSIDDKKYQVLETYNSFEYDFYDNAYIPMFSFLKRELKANLNLERLFEITTSSTVKNTLIPIAVEIVNGLFKQKIGHSLKELKDIGTSLNEEYKKKNDLYKEFNDLLEIKNEIKEEIKKCAKDRPIILIIDELDRCNPRFALDTLEIIKHFLDIENLIIIMALDKEQLQESVKTIYGQNMKANIYFSKFFDYQFNLNKLEISDIVDYSDVEGAPQIIDFAQKLFDDLNISTRDSFKIMIEFLEKYKNKHDQHFDWSLAQSYFILFMLTLKHTDLMFYNHIIDGKFNNYYSIIKQKNDVENNKYIHVIDTNYLGDGKTLETHLNNFTAYKNRTYLKPIPEILNMQPQTDRARNEVNSLKKMMGFIPYISSELTYKETLLNILN